MLCRNVQLSEQRLAKGFGLNGRSGLRSPVQYCSFHFHTLGPADSYNLVFDGLRRQFKDGVSKLGQFVQEKETLWLRVTSPGLGSRPPPTSPVLDSMCKLLTRPD